MNQKTWGEVEAYFNQLFFPHDPILDEAIEASNKAGLPEIAVEPSLGKFLMLMVQIQGAKTILEIGTLGGYSTIWLARGLPKDGRLITLEAVPEHAQVARQNIALAGLGSMVDVRVGNALDTLPELLDDPASPFDFVFLDADKPNNPNYFEWSLKLSRPGSIIIADNVVRRGTVVEANSNDPSTIGVRQFNEMVANEPRVSATALQTVSGKGYDGFVILRVNDV